MKPFQDIDSKAVPWLKPDVDTDTITPMKRLILNADRLDTYSFEPFRFLDGDGDRGLLNPEFPLNQEKYQDAKIMIVGRNFGCGSSRETAPEAILKCGILCLIGSSFATIFYNNCFQQGVLPIVFPEQTVKQLAVEAADGGRFHVSLRENRVHTPSGRWIDFTLDESRRILLLNGLDEVDLTMQHEEQIRAFFSAGPLNGKE